MGNCYESPRGEKDDGENVDSFDRPAGFAVVLNRAGRVRLPRVGGRRRRPCGGYLVDSIYAGAVDSDAGPSPFHDHIPAAGQAVDSMGGVDSHPFRGGNVAAETRVEGRR